MVSTKEKIHDLLATESLENQLLAIELMQSQWRWTWEESLFFALEFYCKKNVEQLSLAIGNIVVSYHLEFMEDYCANAMRAVVELVFKVEQQGKILVSEQLDSCNQSMNQNPTLGDYSNILKNHFEHNLPSLIKFENLKI